MNNHPISSIPLYFAILLERFVYYGTRSIIILYLIDSAINMTFTAAVEVYTWVATLLLFAQIAGGLLGLINQPRALTIAGYAIQFVGATITSLVAGADGLIIGFFLLVIGSGISKTNSLALFAQVYQKSKMLDSAMMMNYGGINIGAFAGALIVPFLADKYSFSSSFSFCAGAMLLALLLLIMIRPTPFIEKKIDHQSKSFNSIFIIIGCIAVSVFWLCYEFLSSLIANLEPVLTNEKLMEFSFTGSSTLNFTVLLITLSILSIYLSFKQIHASIFLSIGFVCGIIAVFFLSTIGNGNISTDKIYFYLIGFYFFITFAELFLVAPLLSFILQKVTMQFIPLVLAGYFGLISLLSQGVQFAYQHESGNTITTCLVLFSLALTGFIILNKVQPKEVDNNSLKDQYIK